MHRTWKHPVAIGRRFSSEFRETSDVGDIDEIGARKRPFAALPERQRGQSTTTNWRTVPPSSRTAFPPSQPCPTVSPPGSGVREYLITIPVGLRLATGTEHRHRARSGASDCQGGPVAAGARHEDLESAVAVLRADADRALRRQGAGILRWQRRFGSCRSDVRAAGDGRPHGLRSRRCRRATGARPLAWPAGAARMIGGEHKRRQSRRLWVVRSELIWGRSRRVGGDTGEER